MSIQDDLDKLNEAILKIQNGAQEMSIGTKRIRKADLKTLYEERNRLERALNAEKGTFSVAVFDGR